MSARDEVLHRIRVALSPSRPHVGVPRNYRISGLADLNLFIERVSDYQATVRTTADGDVASCLSALLPRTVIAPEGFPAGWLPDRELVRDEPPLDVRELDAVEAVLTSCAIGIAETGTVVLDHGPGQGRRALTLVPDHHVVVLRAAQVVAGVPDALRRLDPLRPQTWISGPSATSDIELNRVEGVHGPRRLDVVVVVSEPKE